MSRTFGTVKIVDERWHVSAEPHVMIRLKRLFARVHQKALDTVTMSDTIEVCRDLWWFLERYPMRMDQKVGLYLKRRATEHVELESALAKMLSKGYEPREFALALPPREYQRVAAEMLLARHSLLLADDVGLGKTASAICVLTAPGATPALVVTLTHLPKQWCREIEKFAPGLRTHVLKGGQPYDLGAGTEMPDVIISNYHKLAGWAQTLSPIVKSVVFDEIQELRTGMSSAKGRAARQLAAQCSYRLGLSATPIYNYGSELHAVIDNLAPEALGSREEFCREWCTEARGFNKKASPVKDPAALGMYLREQGLMLRRTRRDVGRELPPLTKVPQHVDTDTRPLDDVRSAAAELARKILRGDLSLERGESMRAAEELSWKLRQATGLAKAPHVADYVRLLVESGEKVVLYGWHREVYSIWQERLHDLHPALYTGSESPTQKEKSVQAFGGEACRVLIISLRAGAGLDGLQKHCRTVVFGELDWSPGVHEQCEGRVARDGQTDPVFAYYLVADEGSDPVVSEALGLKREQIEGLRDPTRPLFEKLASAGDRTNALARSYLAQLGEPLSPTVAPS